MSELKQYKKWREYLIILLILWEKIIEAYFAMLFFSQYIYNYTNKKYIFEMHMIKCYIFLFIRKVNVCMVCMINKLHEKKKK